MLRILLAVSIVSVVGATSARAQTACDPETHENTCSNATTISVCDDQTNPEAPVTSDVDCTFPPEGGGDPQVPNGACASFGCADTTGTGTCAETGPTCLSGSDDPCAGSGFLLDDDTTNDNFAFSSTCQDGLACTTAVSATGQISETCLTQAFVCEAPFTVGCSGDQLILCLGISEDANGNGTLDAGEDDNTDGELDEAVLTAPFVFDCTGAFDGCSDTASDGPIHAAGLYGAGAGAAPDCLLAAEGEGEGEGEGEEGEGEGGEGEGEGERDDEEGDEDPPSSGCATVKQSGTLAILAALGLVIRRRRR